MSPSTPDLLIRRFTPETEKVLNLIPGDIGRPLTDIRLNLDLPDLEERILRTIDTATPGQVEVRDQAGHWHALWIRPYRTSDNRIEGAVLALVNIEPLKHHAADLAAAKKRLEAEIAGHRRTEEELRRFKLICDNASDTQDLIDREGRLLYVNRRACAKLGYTEEELLRMKLWDIDPTCSEDIIKDLFQRLERGRVPPYESIRRRKDGSTFPVEVGLTGVHFDGEPYVFVSVRDITERKKVEKKLEVAVEAAPNAMVMVDQEGAMILVNAQTEKLFGYDRSELIGKPIEMLVPERYRHQHESYQKGFLADPRARPMGAGRDLFAVRKDGSEVPVEIGLNPIETDEGVWVLSAIVDISERKQAEEASRRSHKELERRVRERTVALHQALDALRQQMEQRRELSARLTRLQEDERRRLARELHDTTGQNLVVLKLALAMVQQGAERLDPKSQESLAECQQLIEQCIREVRTLSYLLHPPLLEERGLASALRVYSEGFAQRSGIEVELDFPEDLGRLPQDVELAGFRIVQECLANVHRHSKSATVRVGVERSDDRITLEVRDTGGGFPDSGSELVREAEERGIGIRGMRERLGQLRGSLEIDTGPSGTQVRAVIPLEPGGH